MTIVSERPGLAAAVEAKGGLPEGIPVLTKPIPQGELERIALRVATQSGRFVPAGSGGKPVRRGTPMLRTSYQRSATRLPHTSGPSSSSSTTSQTSVG